MIISRLKLYVFDLEPFEPPSDAVLLSNNRIFVSFHSFSIKLCVCMECFHFDNGLAKLLYIVQGHSIVVVDSFDELIDFSNDGTLWGSELDSCKLTIEWLSVSLAYVNRFIELHPFLRRWTSNTELSYAVLIIRISSHQFLSRQGMLLLFWWRSYSRNKYKAIILQCHWRARFRRHLRCRLTNHKCCSGSLLMEA